MAVDREYRIRITTTAEPAGARQTADALQEVGKAGEKSAEGLKESGQAADKAFVSKTQLKSAVKGLKEEFPELAHVAKLALNPIAFVVAGITGAFALWNKRVEETTRVLAGLELPDIKEDNIGHINANAEAWKNYAEAVKETQEAYTSVAAQSDRMIAKLQKELQINKEWIKSVQELAKARLEAAKEDMPAGEYYRQKGEIDSAAAAATAAEEQQTKQDQWATKLVTALDLQAAAQAKEQEARGIKIGSPEEDANTLKKLQANAEAAEADLKARQDRRIKLQDYQNGQGSWWDSMWVKTQQIYTGMSVAEMIAMESQGEDTDRAIIANYQRFKRGMPSRNDARSRRDQLRGEAKSNRAKAAELGAGIDDEYDAMQQESSATARNSVLNNLTAAYKALAEIKQESARLQKEADEAVRTGRMVTAELSARMESFNEAMREVRQRIARLERTQGF